MNTDQIKLIRDFNSKDDGTGKRLAGSIACVFNNEVAYIDSRDYVVYDDNNQLVHAIRANTENPVEQARFPYRITTGFYDNVQYMEALYDMDNFRKAIQGLFVDSGLINEKQKNHILKWAVGVQNSINVPKQPGPYFKDTILPIGQTPVPEVRADGLHHASSADLITFRNKIEEMITPIIESAKFNPVKKVRNIYDVSVETLDGLGEEINKIVTGFNPIDDLYMASFASVKSYAIYRKDNTADFASEVNDVINNVLKPGMTHEFKLYIEAYNTRVDYIFNISLVKPKVEKPEDFSNAIRNAVSKFLATTKFNHGTVSTSGATLNVTVDSTDIGTDIDSVINFLNTLEAKQIDFNMKGVSVTLNIGDTSSIENFKKGVMNSMPTVNNETVTGSVSAVSAAGNSVVYTLKVKYYNQNDCACSINGVYYNTLKEACAVGGEILMQKDCTEAVSIPAGKTVVIDLNGHKITNADGDTTINNEGNLTIKGNGTIDNITHKKASLYNAKGASATILGGTLVRSAEAGIDSDHNGGNSFYVIQNHGDLVIGADGAANDITVRADGKFSSLITNGFMDTSGFTGDEGASLTIYGGTFAGGINTIKNDELGTLNIHGGKFNNYAQHSLLNWHKCAIDNGNFVGADIPVIGNGKYGMGIGDLTITGGTFESGSADCFFLVSGNPSEDIKISGGTFSSNPKKYVIAGYDVNEADGKFVVVEQSADQKIDDIIANIPQDSGMIVVEDPGVNNSYSIVTSKAGISSCGMFDSIAAIDGLKSITVSDGVTDVVYNAGEDLNAFKASIDALVPSSNTDAEVTLTMTVVV